jgi:hypothetical protein
MTRREPVYRSWFEIQWRKLRNPPPPVLRAVLADLGVAVLGGLGLLAYTLSVPEGTSLALPVLLLAAMVVVVGSVLTYLWVELPTGASGIRRRSAWAGVLGLLAALPIAYIVIVIVLQVVAPALR